MLSSSSPSLLLSALQIQLPSGSGETPACGEATPGFAELLNGLVAPATDGAKPGVKSAAEGPAMAAKAASGGGKNLPVDLPNGAADEAEAAPINDVVSTAEEMNAAVPATLSPSLLPPGPGSLPMSQMPPGNATPARDVPESSRRAATFDHRAAAPVAVLSVRPAGKQKPDAQTAEARPVPVVKITIAAPAQATLPTEVAAPATEAPAPVRSKTARAVDLIRSEAAVPQPSASPVAEVAQADRPAFTTSNVPAPSAPAPAPSPADIDAALDHLVAAREASMPAAAALAIDHAEFGELSIRFEQSADGRLSAEVASADPELQSAVAAAVSADRGPATGEGDTARSAGSPGQRSAAAGGDGARDERDQPGADRELPQKRSPARPQARQTATDQRPGVFA